RSCLPNAKRSARENLRRRGSGVGPSSSTVAKFFGEVPELRSVSRVLFVGKSSGPGEMACFQSWREYVMSKTAGLVLILSGLAVAGYGLSEPLDRSQQTDIAKPPATETAADRAVAVTEVRPAFRRPASFEAPAEVVFVAPRSRELPTPSQRL